MTTTFYRLLGVVTVAALVGCGGNYSNEDLLFQTAIPDKAALASTLTDAQQRLVQQAPTANLTTGHRSGAVAVGDTSGIAQFTIGASKSFNAGLFAILDVLEAVISLPPTERHPDQRIWGPFPDGQHPLFEVRLVMSRAGSRFEYHLDARLRGSTREWTQVMTGDFQTSGGVRKGTGSLHYVAGAARGIGYDGSNNDAAGIDISYQTAQDPVTVDLVVPSKTSPVPIFAFSYATAQDGGGQMRFDVTGQIAGGDTSPLDTLDILSRWKADGSGRADAEVIDGDYVGSAYVECWDTADLVLYSKASWWVPAGSESSCPTF